MPLPLRVDRVFSGKSSILIRLSNPVSFSINENIAVINPQPFIKSGIKKLLYLTEVRASREFASSLTLENAEMWWNSTKFLYGRLRTLEEDFAAFLRAYLLIMVKAKIESEDLVSAAIQYCELIREICEKRIREKHITVEIKKKEKLVDLYKMKDGKVIEKRFKRVDSQLLYPSFVDIELMNLEGIEFSKIQDKELKIKSTIMKYIPLLFYDDLLECMLQNLESLKDFEGDIIDPAFLLENNIIRLFDTKIPNPEQYSWLQEFNEVNINLIMSSFEPTFPYDLR
jgi:hypothetical protein